MEVGPGDAIKDEANLYGQQQVRENEIYASWFALIISNHERIMLRYLFKLIIVFVEGD